MVICLADQDVMAPLSENKPPLQASGQRRPRRWILVLILGALAVIAVIAGIVIDHAEPILRARVIETLSTRFKSKVELDTFRVSVFPALQVSGGDLRIFGETEGRQPAIQPLIQVAEFRFQTGIRDLFRSPAHVNTVYVKGLELNLPPKQERAQMKNVAPQGGKIGIIVDHLVSDTAQLVINTDKPGKLPLLFSIERLTMTRVGPNEPMHFEADLVNPKPVGNIHSGGSFGPWQADSPRDSPIQGTYSFSHADLSTIKGIGGILSSTGKYHGTLDHILVDGTTDTPDFSIAICGRPVPLRTDFHAVVDGTSGDTYLQPLHAKLLDSWLEATGSVVRTKDPQGHRVELDVKIDHGKMEDLLKLAVKRDPPFMRGAVELKTKFELPPGEPDMADRLQLAGSFQMARTSFTNPEVQDKVDAISMRSQGKPKLAEDNIPDNVKSELSGTFRLLDGLLSFSQLQFQVPGTQLDLTGDYHLDGNQFDFRGKVRMDAKVSQMVSGWKSILLKPVDPFFHKNGAGTEVPVKITGTKTELHFGTDFHDKRRD
jgi:AsmA-like C-terminal region